MNHYSLFIYSPYWSTYGGGEKYAAALAAALARMPGVRVVLLSTHTDVSKEQLEHYFGLSLDSVSFEYVRGGLSQVSRRSSQAEVFVYLSNFQHIPSRARRSVLLLQIPYPRLSWKRIIGKLRRAESREALKDFLRRELLSAARSGKNHVVVNSHFVQEVLAHHHGIHSQVLHPPIQDFHMGGIAKQKIILSVGRFFSGLYNEKRYDVLLRAFRLLCRRVSGWEYHIAGSAPTNRESQKFLDELRRESAGLPVHFHVNAGFSELQHLYNEATIFWHGAGYGVDENDTPERLEHFGMTTVEAMSARCIPLVIPRGGPKEIVEPGVNGFVWNSIEELVEQTEQIARGELGIESIATAARARYRRYSFEHFVTNAQSLFSSFIS
jgi:glycosyltransferase involved in cell wall biosynthesis